MQLTKAQIEQVKYQLKKLEITATNDEVRSAAEGIEDFDAVTLSERVVATRTTTLSTPSNQPLESALTPSESLTYPITPNQSNTLTIAQKQALTTIQAQQLSLDLTTQEITHIASLVDAEINDSVDYLLAVSELIKQFITKRNEQAQTLINEQISNIATIINTGNDQLGDIFNGANQQLNDIVSQCQQRREDFKSPYSSRLQGIKEALKVS